MTTPEPIPLRVEFAAMWKAPRARLTVGPRDTGAPLNAATVAYARAVEAWLQRRFWPLLSG